jgi:transcriptional regulator with XRE-family HTH domain
MEEITVLSARLRSLRKEKKLTQEQAGKAIGISRDRYKSYENDLAEPPNEILFRLADFHETTIEYIMGKSDTRNKVNNESDATSSTPDLRKFILQSTPTWNGRELTEKEAQTVISVLEMILEEAKNGKKSE